jgi:4-amino-4-deoxychorismate lyase
MSSSKKFIYPLFESLALQGKQVKNLPYHQLRFERSYQHLYGSPPPYTLISALQGLPLPGSPQRYKLRIRYNHREAVPEIFAYKARKVKHLLLLEQPQISYALKWSDRSELNALYAQKGQADDVLICSQGKVRDSSYANILMLKDGQWFTPDSPLLPGTKRAQLLDQKLIRETSIRVSELDQFEGFQLINALLDFDPQEFTPISHIRTAP